MAAAALLAPKSVWPHLLISATTSDCELVPCAHSAKMKLIAAQLCVASCKDFWETGAAPPPHPPPQPRFPLGVLLLVMPCRQTAAVFLSTLEVLRWQKTPPPAPPPPHPTLQRLPLVCFAAKQTDSPRRVDPDDANVAEENTLLVLLVLTGAASDPPVGLLGELHGGALLLLLRRGAQDGDGGRCRGGEGGGGGEEASTPPPSTRSALAGV